MPAKKLLYLCLLCVSRPILSYTIQTVSELGFFCVGIGAQDTIWATAKQLAQETVTTNISQDQKEHFAQRFLRDLQRIHLYSDAKPDNTLREIVLHFVDLYCRNWHEPKPTKTVNAQDTIPTFKSPAISTGGKLQQELTTSKRRKLLFEDFQNNLIKYLYGHTTKHSHEELKTISDLKVIVVSFALVLDQALSAQVKNMTRAFDYFMSVVLREFVTDLVPTVDAQVTQGKVVPKGYISSFEEGLKYPTPATVSPIEHIFPYYALAKTIPAPEKAHIEDYLPSGWLKMFPTYTSLGGITPYTHSMTHGTVVYCGKQDFHCQKSYGSVPVWVEPVPQAHQMLAGLGFEVGAAVLLARLGTTITQMALEVGLAMFPGLELLTPIIQTLPGSILAHGASRAVGSLITSQLIDELRNFSLLFLQKMGMSLTDEAFLVQDMAEWRKLIIRTIR